MKLLFEVDVDRNLKRSFPRMVSAALEEGDKLLFKCMAVTIEEAIEESVKKGNMQLKFKTAAKPIFKRYFHAIQYLLSKNGGYICRCLGIA